MSSEDSFSAFLNKMSGETGNRKKQPVVEERQPPKKPAPTQRRREEEDYAELPQHEEKKMNRRDVERFTEEEEKPKSAINEEFLDKAYDYAQGVVKVIRNNFKTAEERVVMLESLQKAIQSYLQNIGAQPQQQSYPQQVSESTLFRSNQMSESEWNNMPRTQYEQTPGAVRMNNLTGQQVNLNNQQTPAYNPSLNLGVKVTSDGKTEVDLSRVSANDINEMKVLAGLVGPEADRARQEKLTQPKKTAQLSQEAQEEAAQALREG